VLDGVYQHTETGAVFVEVPAPTDEALQAVLHGIIGRLMKLLIRRGVLQPHLVAHSEGSAMLPFDHVVSRSFAGRCDDGQCLGIGIEQDAWLFIREGGKHECVILPDEGEEALDPLREGPP